ncbi:hypothetical protein [Nocardia terpenica]|uniref:hypothetical protein n=1 Tax=Nocardia terpenica TaxID=455432 RepID=UPI001E4CF05A|nr:hypothetical protein [Nocardia terpenica]
MIIRAALRTEMTEVLGFITRGLVSVGPVDQPQGDQGLAVGPIRFPSIRQEFVMSGELFVTVIGNLTQDPELRKTPVSGGFMNSEGSFARN